MCDADQPAGALVQKNLFQMDADEGKFLNLARNIILNMVDNVVMKKIRYCKTEKAMLDVLSKICEGNDQIRESKMQTTMAKFDKLRMLPNETIDQLDGRFTVALNEIYELGKEFSDKKINYKILKSLTKKWDMKITVMKDCKDLPR